jgi:hypothetical protein
MNTWIYTGRSGEDASVLSSRIQDERYETLYDGYLFGNVKCITRGVLLICGTDFSR